MKAVILRHDHPRSRRIGEALANGARRMGWEVEETTEVHTKPRGHMLAGYGWRNRNTFRAYRAANLPFFYVDLGYWGRKVAGGDYSGFHKVVLNDRHATAYFRRNRPHDRSAAAPPIRPWRTTGSHIVLAGLSAKAAAAIGQRALEWETATIAALRAVTGRPLVYRPKPSWKDAQPIPGTRFSPGSEPIEAVLQNAWALVTLHSNAAVDALAAGIPVYAKEGLASVLSMPSLTEIERPPLPDGREQFIADVGYCHWTRAEIADGTMFRQFQKDGLL